VLTVQGGGAKLVPHGSGAPRARGAGKFKLGGSKPMASAFELYMSYWRAEEALDLERMLSFYGDDSDYEIPSVKIKGSALRARWTKYIALNHKVKHRVLRFADDGNRCFVEYHADIIHPDGKQEVNRGVTIIEGDGKRITRMTAYFDTNQ
jgi:hypothetical protein